MARRTLMLSKGGIFWFISTNCTALSIGVAKTLSFAFALHLDDVFRRKLVRDIGVAALE